MFQLYVWARKESDLRPLSYQDSVLPLNYAPNLFKYFNKKMEKLQMVLGDIKKGGYTRVCSLYEEKMIGEYGRGRGMREMNCK